MCAPLGQFSRQIDNPLAFQLRFTAVRVLCNISVLARLESMLLIFVQLRVARKIDIQSVLIVWSQSMTKSHIRDAHNYPNVSNNLIDTLAKLNAFVAFTCRSHYTIKLFNHDWMHCTDWADFRFTWMTRAEQFAICMRALSSASGDLFWAGELRAVGSFTSRMSGWLILIWGLRSCVLMWLREEFKYDHNNGNVYG